jgi:beta-lactamase regulating signal transducer with metallopeptidase domain
MESLLYNISQVLGITILHSLWQGLLTYAVIRLVLIAFPAASAIKKYNLLYTGLMAMAVWFAYTFFMQAKLYNWTAPAAQHFASPVDIATYNTPVPSVAQQAEQPFYYNYKQLINTYMPYISVLYLLSVVINLVRLAMGWQSIRKIRKRATAAHTWQPLTDKLAERAGILKHVQISFSNLIDVPCAFGYIKPILLLPVSISTQLSSEEIEVIILHELAHIKNNDYILNLIQQIMTLLLFLNPFAQLLSRMINLERENRCDDTVLQIGDPLTYAGALVKLEKTRQNNLQLAMAATGKKYHLFARIQRIMSDQKPAVNVKHLVFGVLIFVGSLGSIAWLNPEIEDGKLVSKRASKALDQLTAIVKTVVTPSSESISESREITALEKTDSLQNQTPAVVPDTTLTPNKWDALINEYRQLMRRLDSDREVVERSPESKRWLAARQTLDSIHNLQYKSVVTPEMQGQQEKAFQQMADYLKKIDPEKRVLGKKMSDLIDQHPEILAFEKESARKQDSVLTLLRQTTGLSASEVYKTQQFKTWWQNQSVDHHLLVVKLSRNPQYIKSRDSLNFLLYSLSNTPEYKAANKAFNTPNAELIEMQRRAEVGLEQYRNAVDQAYAKLKETPESKKFEADKKRRQEILKIFSDNPNLLSQLK